MRVALERGDKLRLDLEPLAGCADDFGFQDVQREQNGSADDLARSAHLVCLAES